ncbi:MAG: MBL fold metallo-hydrolase [Acidobacteria bacterium]|nr:MBL fold metallo-hydrolase [Acidobacteriota bacterium]
MKLPCLAFLLLPAVLPAAGTLDIYFIDVEGGAATLVVTPEKESLLMDAGWQRDDARDAKRIVEVAAKQAGLKQLDYFFTSHFHADHVGGLPALAGLISIGKFVDHGERVGSASPRDAAQWEAYLKLAEGKRWSARPGDKLPFKTVSVVIVSSDGQVLDGPKRPNPLCAGATLKQPDPGEDARSVGFLVSMGKFRFLDLGDLSWNKEHELACPENRLAEVDVYQVTMHGMPMSGAPQQVWSVKPAVAVMNNGHRKGGTPAAYETVRKSPGLQDLWQLHYAMTSDKEHNTDERMIANLGEDKDCAGHWLRISVPGDGSYAVYNSRNGFSKTYRVR